MLSHHITNLQLPHVPSVATEAHIFPSITDHSLVSIGQLCDSGCLATFDAATVTVTHEDRIVLQGQRDDTTKLWTVPITTQPSNISTHSALNVNLSTKVTDLIAFAHGAMFSPAISTLKKALRNNFITIPGLTIENLTKHPPPIVATTKGHLDQVRKNKQSTATPPDGEDESFPEQQPKTNICCIFPPTTKHRQNLL
jgi:hypothetical protein